MKSVVMRIPVSDYREIDKIAKEHKINIGAAYGIWKKRKLDIKWQD